MAFFLKVRKIEAGQQIHVCFMFFAIPEQEQCKRKRLDEFWKL